MTFSVELLTKKKTESLSFAPRGKKHAGHQLWHEVPSKVFIKKIQMLSIGDALISATSDWKIVCTEDPKDNKPQYTVYFNQERMFQRKKPSSLIDYLEKHNVPIDLQKVVGIGEDVERGSSSFGLTNNGISFVEENYYAPHNKQIRLTNNVLYAIEKHIGYVCHETYRFVVEKAQAVFFPADNKDEDN